MDVRKLIRNPEAIKGQLKKQADNSLITNKGCKIYIPARFAERNLADLGVDNYIVGMFAMTVDDTYYSFCNINALIQITPDAINKVNIEGEDYFEFVFMKGSTVIKNTFLIMNDVLVFRIYDEFMSKGNIPWYMSYEDSGKMFETAGKHGGTSVGSNPEVVEMLIATIFRDAKDRNIALRTIINTREDLKTKKFVTIPLRSVAYAASNTTNKLAGSYFSVGLTSALVNPTERTEKIEAILRD